LRADLAAALDSTVLPASPDRARVDDFLVDVRRSSL
jgi:hypothetical protein